MTRANTRCEAPGRTRVKQASDGIDDRLMKRVSEGAMRGDRGRGQVCQARQNEARSTGGGPARKEYTVECTGEAICNRGPWVLFSGKPPELPTQLLFFRNVEVRCLPRLWFAILIHLRARGPRGLLRIGTFPAVSQGQQLCSRISRGFNFLSQFPLIGWCNDRLRASYSSFSHHVTLVAVPLHPMQGAGLHEPRIYITRALETQRMHARSFALLEQSWLSIASKSVYAHSEGKLRSYTEASTTPSIPSVR